MAAWDRKLHDFEEHQNTKSHILFANINIFWISFIFKLRNQNPNVFSLMSAFRSDFEVTKQKLACLQISFHQGKSPALHTTPICISGSSPLGNLTSPTWQLSPTQHLLGMAGLWGRRKLSWMAMFQKASNKKNHKGLVRAWRSLEITLFSFVIFLFKTLKTREWLSQRLQSLEPKNLRRHLLKDSRTLYCALLS